MVLPVFLEVFFPLLPKEKKEKRDVLQVKAVFFMLCGGFLAVAAWQNRKPACHPN
jgi:hypothetical protein